MQYVKYLPVQPLKDIVECYFTWKAPAPIQPIWIDSPPSAFTAIVLNLAQTHSVRLNNKYTLKLPSSFVSGQSVSNYSLLVDSKIDQVGIVFKPTGLFHLFNLQMFEFTNIREDLHQVLPHDFLQIREKLAEIRADQARIKLLDELLVNRLKKVQYTPDGVDKAASRIIDGYGNVNITQLLTDAYMSRRKFERHFLQRVGLSPKYYARIRRYGYVCSQMAGQREVSWDKLLYLGGYYDQSHFIKDFKEFSGKSPKEYLLTNKELAHALKE